MKPRVFTCHGDFSNVYGRIGVLALLYTSGRTASMIPTMMVGISSHEEASIISAKAHSIITNLYSRVQRHIEQGRMTAKR